MKLLNLLTVNIKTLNKQPKLILIFAAGTVISAFVLLSSKMPGFGSNMNDFHYQYMPALFCFTVLLVIVLKTIRFFVVLLLMFFCSCTGKPSEKDIAHKILLEYVCSENAKVDDLEIINLKETQSLLGLPALQYTVSGEIEWANGCNEAFSNLPAGYKEAFQNKTITLVKVNHNWQ